MLSAVEGSEDTQPQRNYVMNACLICNAVFLVQRNGTPADGIVKIRTLRGILLQVQNENDGIVPETNILCQNCNKAVDEILKLKKQIEGLIKMVEEVRKRLGKKVVDSYATTNKNRKNYHVKRELFEAWYSKSNEVPGPNELERRFHSILGVLDHQRTSAEHLHNSSFPLASELVSQNDPDIPGNIHVEHDDNDSTGCPSPMSLPPVDDDFEGDLPNVGGPDPEIHMPNLPEDKLTRAHVANSNPKLLSSTSDNVMNSQKPIPVPPAVENIEIETETDQNHHVPVGDEPSHFIDGRKNRPIIKTRRRTHPCKFCGKLFPTDFSLQMHERTHTGEKPFACSICGRPFNNKAAMQKHEQTHDPSRYQGEPQFKCDICGKKYYLKLTLSSHKREHQGHKRKPQPKRPRDANAPKKIKGRCRRCEICGKPYYHATKLKDHIKSHDPTFLYNKYFRYQCPACPPEKLGFPNRIAVRQHLRKYHPDEPVPELFKNKWNERRSLKNKNKEKGSYSATRKKRPYKPRGSTARSNGRPKKSRVCSYCGKEFKMYQNLVYHIRLHTGEKPFQCSVCNRRFTGKENLQKHMKSHDPTRFAGEGSYVCDICGKAFHLRNSLYHHRRRHLGLEDHYKSKGKCGWTAYREKLKKPSPCECQICGRKYESRWKLMTHKYGSHSTKVLKCRICEKPFSHSTTMKMHEKSHDPTYSYNKYFRHQCPSCPPEKLGFPNQKAFVVHWKDAHADQELPDAFKKLSGEHKCTICEESYGKIPTYRRLESLQRHNKLYHSENGKMKGRKWIPKYKYKSKYPKEDNFTTSDEDSDSASDLELGSESASGMELDSKTTKVPTRRSVRETRGQMSKLTKLLNGPDSEELEAEEELVERKVLKTAKTSKKMSRVKKSMRNASKRIFSGENDQKQKSVKTNSSSKISESYIRDMLGRKELRIILTKLDESDSPNSQSQERDNANAEPRSSTKRTVPCPMSRKSQPNIGQSPESISTEKVQNCETMMDEDSSDVVPADDPLFIPEEPLPSCSSAAPDEVKVETEDCVDDYETPSQNDYTSRPWASSRSILSNGPIIIHNPLSKNKTSNPIIIKPTSANE